MFYKFLTFYRAAKFGKFSKEFKSQSFRNKVDKFDIFSLKKNKWDKILVIKINLNFLK